MYSRYINISLYAQTMSKLSISLEFFPPRNETQLSQFWTTLRCLQSLEPDYISMTWGALGAASQASLDILKLLVEKCDSPVTAHLSCSGETRSSMLEKIITLENLGITRFLALRGDPVKIVAEAGASAGIRFNNRQTLQHASDLVALLAERGHEHISVAAYPDVHPESADAHSDTQWLKYKLDAGANRAITQFFFEAESFLRFRDRCTAAGIKEKLIPGILPVHDIEKVSQFSQKCGAVLPSKQLIQFQQAKSCEDKHQAAVAHSLALCHKLRLEGVDEFHFYSLNQAALTHEIVTRLRGGKVDTALKASTIAVA